MAIAGQYYHPGGAADVVYGKRHIQLRLELAKRTRHSLRCHRVCAGRQRIRQSVQDTASGTNTFNMGIFTGTGGATQFWSADRGDACDSFVRTTRGRIKVFAQIFEAPSYCESGVTPPSSAHRCCYAWHLSTDRRGARHRRWSAQPPYPYLVR